MSEQLKTRLKKARKALGSGSLLSTAMGIGTTTLQLAIQGTKPTQKRVLDSMTEWLDENGY